MQKMLLLIAVVMLVVLPCSAMGEPIKAKHSVELDDPAGDVLNEDGDLGKDVVKLVLASDGKDLQVTATLEKEITHYLVGNMAGDLLQINMDTDTNAATGGKTSWGNKEGFEQKVSVRTCIEYKNGGEACVGGMETDHEKYFSSYNVEKLEQGSTSGKNTHDIFWTSPQADITGKTVTSKISYSDIGVSSGQTIRLAIREADSSYDAKSFFPEILFILK
jgi:hypothetical protein